MITLDVSELRCSLCQNELDTKNRQPRLLPKSGQTICQVCVYALTNDQQQCGEVKPQIEDFPLNQTLIRLLSQDPSRGKADEQVSMSKLLSDHEHDALTTSFDELPVVRNLANNFLDDQSDSCRKRKSKSSLRLPFKRGFATQSKDELQVRHCMIHKRSIEVVCLDCKEMICTNCALFGQHKGHSIYSEDDLLMMLGDKAQDIFEKIECVQKQCQSIQREEFDIRFKESVREMAGKLQTKIRQEFNNLRMLVEEQETKAINQVIEQVQQRSSQWDGWWDSNIMVTCTIEQALEWCQQARQLIESVADIKGNRTPYWDLLNWSESIRSKGSTIYRELQTTTVQVEQQLTEAGKCLLQVQFNTLPVSMAIEDFFRVVKQPSMQIKRLQSPQGLRGLMNPQIFPVATSHEDSDLLSNAEDLGKSIQDSDCRQSQQSIMNDTYTSYIEPLQQTNSHFSSIKVIPQQKNGKMKVPCNLNASRNQRSATPQYSEDLSLSPVPIQGKETNRKDTTMMIQKKKTSLLASLPIKIQQQLEALRSSVEQPVIDFSGLEVNGELASYLGSEAKQWRTKTLKLMKCKLTDEGMQSFFQALGGFNDSIQAINLAQNNLSDRTIDVIKEMVSQDFLNRNIKNIILSQNKINARKCQSKVLELKRSGLTITL